MATEVPSRLRTTALKVDVYRCDPGVVVRSTSNILQPNCQIRMHAGPGSPADVLLFSNGR